MTLADFAYYIFYNIIRFIRYNIIPIPSISWTVFELFVYDKTNQ